tara:strand:+ start:65 stop:586 length:522 start_codon:yes stop_codon:yes gene_type:complete
MGSTLTVDNIVGASTAANVNFPAGTMVQQVNSVNNAAVSDRVYQSTTSQSATHMSNFDITITPKFASSKIFYAGSFSVYGNSSGYVYLYLYRHIAGGSATKISTSAHGNGAVQQNVYQMFPLIQMDSPNTTSAVTYKIYARSHNGGAIYVGWENTVGAALDNQTNFAAFEIRA